MTASQNKNYTPSYTVFAADLGYYENNARRYKEGAILIKNGDLSTCTPSFHLLSTIAFELFAKTLLGYKVCQKNKMETNITEDAIKDEISKEMRRYMHHLGRLYKELPDMLDFMGVEDVSEVKNGFVWDYRFKLKSCGKEIILKDVEAIRYGSFAKNSNVMTWCVDDDEIIGLLNKAEEYVAKQKKEVRVELLQDL